MCEYCGNTGLCYVLFCWLGGKIYRGLKQCYLKIKKGREQAKSCAAGSHLR
jgi:hypothetical protein